MASPEVAGPRRAGDRYWKRPIRFHCEGTEEDEREHIALWNSIVGNDELVLYVGDFCDGNFVDLEYLHHRLNGRKILIKGNHDMIGDEWYREMFEEVVDEKSIDELNLRLIHIREALTNRRPDERVIYGHEHNYEEQPLTTSDSICVCAKWHEWKPISLAEAIRQMDAAERM